MAARGSAARAGAEARSQGGGAAAADGLLEIDDEVFTEALSDRFSEVVTLLSADTNNQTTIGDADRGIAGDAIQTLTELMASDGTLMSQSNSLSSKVDDYQEAFKVATGSKSGKVVLDWE